MNVLDLVREKGVEVKKAASTKGGEYHCTCPACGGTDRFHVWPDQNNGSGSYWCRGCEKAGDNIQFLIDFDGCSYPEACDRLEIEPKTRKPFRTPQLPHRSSVKKSNAGAHADPYTPPAIWMERAEKVVAWTHENLLKNRKQLNWLKTRGIGKESVEKYRLGWNPEDLWRPRQAWGLEKEINEKTGKPKMVWIPAGLVIPMTTSAGIVRIRLRRPEGEPRYYVIPGSAMQMMTAAGPGRAIIVVESELDMILIDALAGDLVGAIALGSSSVKPDPSVMAMINPAAVVLVAVDFDLAGAKALSWWKEHISKARRWPVPVGKDPGEAHLAGIDLREWIIAGLPKAWVSGQSLLESRKNRVEMEQNSKRFENTEAGQGPAAAAQPHRKDGDGLSESVAELVRLVRQYPVEILNRPDRLKLIENKEWARKNWAASRRISELVYRDPEVFVFISAHPAEKIDGNNIWVNSE